MSKSCTIGAMFGLYVQEELLFMRVVMIQNNVKLYTSLIAICRVTCINYFKKLFFKATYGLVY